MSMPVVNIRVVWMSVREGVVCVAVTVFAAFTTFKIMLMLVVHIMLMFVVVLKKCMLVFMDMVLSEVQPYAHAHQHRCNPECKRRRFRENKQGYCCANERCS